MRERRKTRPRPISQHLLFNLGLNINGRQLNNLTETDFAWIHCSFVLDVEVTVFLWVYYVALIFIFTFCAKMYRTGHELNKAEECIHLFPTLAVLQKTWPVEEFPGFKTRIYAASGATSVGAKKRRRGEEDQLALHRGSWYCVATSWGKLSLSIKMRGRLRGAEGVQVSEGIIYERG